MRTTEKLIKKDASRLLTTKSGRVKKYFIDALAAVRIEDRKVYYNRWTIRGGRGNLKSYDTYIKLYCNIMGYKYTEGNDAPRGGAEGAYLKLDVRALRSLGRVLTENR